MVPTWNDAVVHVSATLKAFREPQYLLALVEKLTQRQEADQPHPWKVSDAPPEFTERMLGSIVGLNSLDTDEAREMAELVRA